MTLKVLIWLFYGSLMGISAVIIWHPILSFLNQLRSLRFIRTQMSFLKKKSTEKHDEEDKQEEITEDQESEEQGFLKKEGKDSVPREVIPLIRRAEALIARNEWEDAKKVLIKILSLSPTHIDASSHLAFTYLKTGEFTKAENLFRKVLEEKPQDPAILTNYALCIFEQKDPSRIRDSITALELATKIDSKNANRYSNLGQSYYFSGNILSAISAFEQAVRLSPKNLEYHFFLADSFLSMEKYPEAKSVFEKILEISPLNKEAKEEINELKEKGY